MLSSFPNLIAGGLRAIGSQSWARAGSNATASKNACAPEGALGRVCLPAKPFAKPAIIARRWLPCQTSRLALQGARLLDQRLRIADLELARRLDVERLDDAVLDEHRVALRAHSHAARRQVERQAGRAREVGAAVGHHPNLAGGLLVATPGAHHERIVDGDAPDLVDADGLQRS